MEQILVRGTFESAVIDVEQSEMCMCACVCVSRSLCVHVCVCVRALASLPVFSCLLSEMLELQVSFRQV